MKNTRPVIHEGYWRNTAHPELPMPKARNSPWKGQRTFLKQLHVVETGSETKQVHYRGYSRCRLCGAINGTAEYEFKTPGIVVAWPEGLSHYVGAHNVRPSQMFLELITQLAKGS